MVFDFLGGGVKANMFFRWFVKYNMVLFRFYIVFNGLNAFGCANHAAVDHVFHYDLFFGYCYSK